DPSRVAVGGDSAGGNLAAVVAQDARRRGPGAAPALQLLIYPAIDGSQPWPSRDRFAEGLVLTRQDMEWVTDHYCGGQSLAADARLNPGQATDLGGLAPALVITAGFDPLRDEGEAYAAHLLAAGTPTTLRRYAPLTHGFIHFIGVSPTCR